MTANFYLCLRLGHRSFDLANHEATHVNRAPDRTNPFENLSENNVILSGQVIDPISIFCNILII